MVNRYLRKYSRIYDDLHDHDENDDPDDPDYHDDHDGHDDDHDGHEHYDDYGDNDDKGCHQNFFLGKTWAFGPTRGPPPLPVSWAAKKRKKSLMFILHFRLF